MKGNIIVKNASQVITFSGFKARQGTEMSDLNIINDGSVIIEDGFIKHVGKTSDILKNINDKVYIIIDAKGKAVLPGFVDSHTHFVFAGYRGEEFSWRLAGQSYMDIMYKDGGIINSVQVTKKHLNKNSLN